MIDYNKKGVHAEVMQKKQLLVKPNFTRLRNFFLIDTYKIFSKLNLKKTEEIFMNNKTKIEDTCCKFTCCADGCCSEGCKTGECSDTCCKNGCCVDSANCCS